MVLNQMDTLVISNYAFFFQCSCVIELIKKKNTAEYSGKNRQTHFRELHCTDRVFSIEIWWCLNSKGVCKMSQEALCLRVAKWNFQTKGKDIVSVIDALALL